MRTSIRLLVPVSLDDYSPYTPGLSTWWSTRSLCLTTGDLFLQKVSRLDAFSVYPGRT